MELKKMEIKTINDFVEAVKKMRKAQNKFFKSHAPNALNEAKLLENNRQSNH